MWGWIFRVSSPATAAARSSMRAKRYIQHTVRYAELAPDRFKDFWRDN
jgi:hypothetical protein